MLAFLDRLLERLFVALALIATGCGVMIIALVCSSVLMRHVANAPFRFTEELVGLLMTAAFFLSLPLVTFRARHVRVQILVNALPQRFFNLTVVLAAVFGVAFTAWFLWLCIPWLEFAMQRNIKSEVGRLLLYPWMAIVPLSMLLTALAFMRAGYSSMRRAVSASLTASH